MSWQAIAAQAQAAVNNAIPAKWKLGDNHSTSEKCVLGVPRTCGLLTEEQLSITEQTATELVDQLARGKLTSAKVVEAFCGRAAIAHQLVNCLTAYFPDEALKRAQELDDHLQKTGKPVGPLHGLPVALKDTFDMMGRPATYGYAAGVNREVKQETTIIKMLRDAGAVFYVRTTMPQTGMALETASNVFGRTLNPFNTDFVAGGSSGGDAVLVALHGSPVTPSTDIGGSVRAPAAYNGLYGMRPTTERIPKEGMWGVESGQGTIKTSCGPQCHSMDDVKMFTEVLNAHPAARYDPYSSPVPWKKVEKPRGKLAFGLIKFDGVVKPHPPIFRAMDETAAKLKAEGHEVVEFRLPFDCWESSKVTFKLYYLRGVEGIKATLAQTGESLLPSVKKMYDIYNPQPLTADEYLQATAKQKECKVQFRDAWEETVTATTTGRPIDALICPVGASAGFPHDFLPWWGYTSLFNLLDYPSIVVPLKDFKISPEQDPKDLAYKPSQENPFDQSNYEIYDPVLYRNQPVTIQVVGRPFEDEQVISVAQVVDELVNV